MLSVLVCGQWNSQFGLYLECSGGDAALYGVLSRRQAICQFLECIGKIETSLRY